MLTQRQLQLLKFIQDYVLEHNVSPSFEEMRSALRLKSKSGIHRLIQGLEERGFIRRLAYRARALEVVKLADAPAGEAGEDALEASSNVVRGAFRRPRPRAAASGAGSAAGATTTLPIYGRIAAGTPIEALADTSAALEVPSLLVGPGEHYVLQVVGESMIEAGILDGDYAIIQRCDNAENGSIVVALVEDREVTLKRLRRRGASVALEPANAAFETRIFGPSQVRVQGRLVGLIRRY